MTHDTWPFHLTPDTWHLTPDMWWGVNILSKSQLFSSYGWGVMMFWKFGGKGLLSYFMNYKGVRLNLIWGISLSFCPASATYGFSGVPWADLAKSSFSFHSTSLLADCVNLCVCLCVSLSPPPTFQDKNFNFHSRFFNLLFHFSTLDNKFVWFYFSRHSRFFLLSINFTFQFSNTFFKIFFSQDTLDFIKSYLAIDWTDGQTDGHFDL